MDADAVQRLVEFQTTLNRRDGVEAEVARPLPRPAIGCRRASEISV